MFGRGAPDYSALQLVVDFAFVVTFGCGQNGIEQNVLVFGDFSPNLLLFLHGVAALRQTAGAVREPRTRLLDDFHFNG